jgi:hypothetical protein
VLLALFPPTRPDVLACIRPLRMPLALAVAFVIAGASVPGPALIVGLIASVLFVASCVAFGAFGVDDVRLLRRVLMRARPLTPIDPSLGAE